MKLITIRSQILEVVTRWKGQYPKPKTDKLATLRKLQKLDLTTATENDLKEIIGNSSWAGPRKCYECQRYFDEVLQVGEEPDYEACTTWLCKNCVEKALKLFPVLAEV